VFVAAADEQQRSMSAAGDERADRVTSTCQQSTWKHWSQSTTHTTI